MAAVSKRGKAWCFTLNNYTKDDETKLMEETCSKYLIFGREVGESGTPHLQGYINYGRNNKSFKQMKELLPRANLRKADGNAEENFNYCSKDGDFFEKGVRPLSQKEKGASNKRRYEIAWECAMNDDFDSIDADIRNRYYNTLKKIKKDASMMTPKEDTTEKMLWYWGKAGTGKSRKAREDHPDCFLKSCNKLWDGYIPGSRATVLMKDFDKRHEVLIHDLKIWGDRYDFLAEVKGSTMRIRPERIIITSNYHPSQIWTKEQDLAGILRRFKCVEFKTLGVQVEGSAPKQLEPDFTPPVVVVD